MWTIIVAAGTGTRFGTKVPKQFSVIAGRRVLDWSIEAASAASEGVVVVLPARQHAAMIPTLTTYAAPQTEMIAVPGGATRSESVRAGLAAIAPSAEVILVHDAARPVADVAVFGRVIGAVRNGAKGVVPVAAVVDTVRHLDGVSIDRDKLQIVQTPQGFSAGALRDAHAANAEATDDATLIAQAGGTVETVDGGRWNIKLTTPEDALVLEAILAAR